MITIFRRIREKLIASGSISRYLLYAIGEILLVVIGILIALQVNNWNNQKTEYRISKEYHQRMVSDIEQLSQSLNAELERTRDIQNNISKAVNILENKSFSDSASVILNSAIRRYFQLAPFSLQISSYEEMKSTGRLNLIYNIELRQTLNKYSSFAILTSRITEQFSRNVNGSSDLFNRYIQVYVDEQNNISQEYSTEEIARDQLFINTMSRFTYDWYSYGYFIEQTLQQLNKVRDDLELELKTYD